MRTDICDAIEQIPETIANVQTMMNLYPQGGKLQAHASSLFVAIIDLLNHSLYWFKRNPILKFGAAILSGDEYGQKLQKRLSGMTSVVNRIDKQASIHQQQGQAESQSSLSITKTPLTGRRSTTDRRDPQWRQRAPGGQREEQQIPSWLEKCSSMPRKLCRI